ncbi:hypothetical protein CLV40_14716 [Actinokineospora auranticolor]|uniref:Transposase IS116/IS110/IS902 family protein n=1 Tax=Actinokineospora auranticolor TaxID=155976 RepID=A0A2S6GB57_9PSEU|nr:hypothetical protein CLV40_14716 [Actinokineospora auranticolor]
MVELEILVGFDDDLADEATRIANRVRGLRTRRAPLAEGLTWVPDIGVRTTARILLEIGDTAGFAGSAHVTA